MTSGVRRTWLSNAFLESSFLCNLMLIRYYIDYFRKGMEGLFEQGLINMKLFLYELQSIQGHKKLSSEVFYQKEFDYQYN